MTKKEKLKEQIEFYGGFIDNQILNTIEEFDLEEIQGFVLCKNDVFYEEIAKNHSLLMAGLL